MQGNGQLTNMWPAQRKKNTRIIRWILAMAGYGGTEICF